MKIILLSLNLILVHCILHSQVINWATETGLPLGSTLTDGQIIPNFGGSGVTVTINVNVVGSSPSINASDGTRLNVGGGNNGCSITLTTSGGIALDLVLNNNQNLQQGEIITITNVDNENITIQETGSNGGGRMTVDGVAMTGALPSTIVEDDTAVVREVNNGAGTHWNATMSGITSFTWLYNTAVGTSANEGFIMTLTGSTLPVELSYFDAILINDNLVRLEWETASEMNNDFFIVEKSLNAIDWNEAIRIKGAGNSSTILSYWANDNNPYLGISYYRLKQVDFDGKYSYSHTKSVTILFLGEKEMIVVYPNPASDKIYVEDKFVENNQYYFYNSQGQNIMNRVGIIKKGNGFFEIDISNLNRGVYYVKNSKALKVKKIIKL